jgi:hypothetical protein
MDIEVGSTVTVVGRSGPLMTVKGCCQGSPVIVRLFWFVGNRVQEIDLPITLLKLAEQP